MAMERSDAIGLAATVGIHAALIAVIALGLFGMEDKIEKPQSIAVTLEGDGSPLPVTGEVGDGEIAPEPSEEAEPELEAAAEEASDEADAAASQAADEAAKAEREAREAAAAASAANASAEQKRKAREAAKRAADAKRKKAEAERKRKADAERKRKAAAEKRRKAEAERKRKAAAAAAAKRKKELDERLGNAVGGGDNAPSAGATRRARASIGGQIRIRGCPSGLDVQKLVTRVTINLNRNGSIASLTNISQSGTTASNRPQLEPTKRCILSSIRAAAPFRGLDPANYLSWKSIRIGFKAN